jgi:hypothetical protein
MRRGDGAETRFAYDTHALLLTDVTNPLGNVLTAVKRLLSLGAVPPDRCEWQLARVRYDPLGVIVAETRSGHVDQDWGFDALDAVAVRTPASLAEALADPKS